MKVFSTSLLSVCAALSLFVSSTVSVKTTRARASATSKVAKANAAISEIVKEMKAMAETSEAAGEAEAKTFGDYKCFNDKVIANKTAWIATTEDNIETTEIHIEHNIAKLATLESQVEQLKKDITENELTQNQTIAVREKANAAFLAENTSMSGALQQLSDAFTSLSSNGSNGSSFLQLTESPDPLMMPVVQQLLAASKAEHEDVQKPKAQGAVLLDVDTDTETPGGYDSQTGGVLGVLRSTRDSYAKNLQDLQDAEAKQQASYEKLMTKMKDQHTLLEEQKATNNEAIAQTETDLGTLRTDLTDLKALLKAEQDSKATLEDTLAKKTATYEERKLLRSEEDAAISKAISILNSDSAFESFTKVALVQEESFLQLDSSARSEMMQRRQQVMSYLRSQAHLSRSTRLAKLAVFMSKEEPENPFNKVMDQIGSMKVVIDKESKSDTKKFDTCAKDREENNKEIEAQVIVINAQNEKITDNTNSIGSVENETGLANDLKTAKEQLAASIELQESTTKARAAENKDYQQNIADLQVAQNLVKQAIKVLRTYYDKIALVQAQSEEETTTPEPTYEEGKFEGQSTAGNSVLTLMDTMLANTAKAEADAHKDENGAQADFEDAMKTETDNEADLKKSIADKKKEIAEKNMALDESNVLLADAQKQKALCEKYLLDIKPSCDFIAANFDQREANRAAEKASLDNAIKLIEGTPAYKNFEAALHPVDRRASMQ